MEYGHNLEPPTPPNLRNGHHDSLEMATSGTSLIYLRNGLVLRDSSAVANPNAGVAHDNPAYHVDISDSVSNGGGGVELNNWGGGAGSANSGKQLQIQFISSYVKNFLAFGCFSSPVLLRESLKIVSTTNC